MAKTSVCRVCGVEATSRMTAGRCSSCAHYFYRHGTEQPSDFIRHTRYTSTDACRICGCDKPKPYLRKGRCGRCSSYFYGTGSEWAPEIAKPRHGHAPERGVSREYAAWLSIKNRCFNPNQISYSVYGGRGITMDTRWASSFPVFLAEITAAIGPRPAGTTLDRIDNDGHYVPGNVRWATRFEQDRNTRRNHRLTFNGETLCLMDWAKRLGLEFGTLRSRLRYGWTVEKALSVPVAFRRKRASA